MISFRLARTALVVCQVLLRLNDLAIGGAILNPNAAWYIEQLLWGEHCQNGRRLDQQSGLSLERIVLDHKPEVFSESDRQQAKRMLGIT